MNCGPSSTFQIINHSAYAELSLDAWNVQVDCSWDWELRFSVSRGMWTKHNCTSAMSMYWACLFPNKQSRIVMIPLMLKVVVSFVLYKILNRRSECKRFSLIVALFEVHTIYVIGCNKNSKKKLHWNLIFRRELAFATQIFKLLRDGSSGIWCGKRHMTSLIFISRATDRDDETKTVQLVVVTSALSSPSRTIKVVWNVYRESLDRDCLLCSARPSIDVLMSRYVCRRVGTWKSRSLFAATLSDAICKLTFACTLIGD